MALNFTFRFRSANGIFFLINLARNSDLSQRSITESMEPFDSILERICNDDIFLFTLFIPRRDFQVRKTSNFLIKNFFFL